MDEDDLVALAVAVEVVRLALRDAEPDLDVAVVLEHAPAEHGVAHRLELHRVREPVHVRLRHPLLELDPLEVADLLHPAGREQVVEDRLVAGEALEAHDLLDEQRRVAVRVGIAVLDVALGRDPAQAGVAHQSLLSVGFSTRPTNNSVPVGACSTAHVKGRSKTRWKGLSGHRDGAGHHRGRGGGAGAGLVDVDAGALEHAAEALVAGAGDELLEVAPELERGAEAEVDQRLGQLELRGGAEARQLDGALAAAPLDLVPVAEHRHEAQVGVPVRQPDRVVGVLEAAFHAHHRDLAGALERRRTGVLEGLRPTSRRDIPRR